MRTHEPGRHTTGDLSPALEAELRAAIPDHLLDGLDAYIADYRRPGGFLEAVLENNLLLAICRANEQSLGALVAIVRYLLQCAPSKCWGSRAAVALWLDTAAAQARRARLSPSNQFAGHSGGPSAFDPDRQ